MKVYLDNGATTRVADEVWEAMKPFFVSSYGNPSCLYELGRNANKATENARAVIAKKINAEPSEIIFTSGGTESDNLAIKGVAYDNKNKGNHIITSAFEHPAVLNTCKELEKEGFKVTYLPVSEEGFVSVADIKKAINNKTVLVTIMHANNEIGTIQPIGEIGRICRGKGIIFHTDAVQSFTKTLIDVKMMNIDLASFSAHKIHGPKGIGVLYVRKGVKLKKQNIGGHQEFDLRAGTENVAGAVGFARAAELIKEEDIKRMTKLRNKLIDGLLKIKDTQLNGSRENRLCNNVNISFKHIEGEGLLMRLDEEGIAVATGSACSSHSLEPSHVLLAIGLKHEVAHGSLRLTLSKYTTEAEIDYALGVLPKAVGKLRRISPFGGKHVF